MDLRGHRVEDLSSGLVGVVTGMSRALSRQEQALIQPTAKDGAKPKGVWVDIVSLKDLGPSEIVVTPPDPTELALGDKLLHAISGVEGVAIDQIVYLNGCVHFGVMPPASERHPEPIVCYFDHKQLARVAKAVEQPVAAGCGGPDREHWSDR